MGVRPPPPGTNKPVAYGSSFYSPQVEAVPVWILSAAMFLNRTTNCSDLQVKATGDEIAVPASTAAITGYSSAEDQMIHHCYASVLFCFRR